MSKPNFETTLDDLDRRIYEIIYRETVEDVASEWLLVVRIRLARRAVEALLNKGEVLGDDLIRCAIRETAKRKSGYNPADHGGYSYAQHAKREERARENAQGSWLPRWMRHH